MPFDSYPNGLHYILGGLFNPILSHSTMHGLIRAFRERYGDAFDQRVTTTDNTISAETTLAGCDCDLTIIVEPDCVTQVIRLIGCEVTQMLGCSYFYDQFDRLLAPDTTKAGGRWRAGSVPVDMRGLGQPSDPVVLVIRHSRSESGRGA